MTRSRMYELATAGNVASHRRGAPITPWRTSLLGQVVLRQPVDAGESALSAAALMGSHLHFHVSESASALGGDGVPFVFSAFEVLGGRRSTLCVLGAPSEPAPVIGRLDGGMSAWLHTLSCDFCDLLAERRTRDVAA